MDWSDQITFIIPTAPHALVPSTEMIEEVIASVRYYFPTSAVYLMADGCADYLARIPGREMAYEEYLAEVGRLCTEEWENVHLERFVLRKQQAEMTRRTLDKVTTKYLFFLEHDTPLRTDREFHWDAIFRTLDDNQANMVRLSYWEEGVHEAHHHLTRGEFEVDDVRFVRTSQYSQWPHVSTTDFYRRMLAERIPAGIVTMIEIYLYGPALDDPDYFNIVMYCPEGGAQRFHHRNGRKDDPCDW